jgi:tetratricopeptide (TPR) repeat protein
MKNNDEKNSLQFEIDFFERILKKDPNFVDALIPLAHSYTQAGEHKKALEADKKLATLLPNSNVVFYNLACSYALLHRTDDALAALQKAIKLGYNDFAHIIKDKDLDSLRTDERFSRIVALVSRKKLSV